MFWLMIKCCCCPAPAGQHRRQNTAYLDDELNWIYVCDRCNEDIEEYWKDMWEDYYRSR